MTMNVSDFMAKHGITDADLDRMAEPYESGDFEPEPGGEVFSGSHLDAVGTRDPVGGRAGVGLGDVVECKTCYTSY